MENLIIKSKDIVTVSSSQQHILEKRICNTIKKLFRKGYIIYDVEQYTDDTNVRRKMFKADIKYYVVER